LLAFTGVRGIVSLAAALAIPLATVNGQPFPYRDLILFLTFAVILVTLVGQGLMLPWVIRALGLAPTGRRERDTERAEEHTARRQAIEAAIARLDQLAAERTLSEEIVQPIRSNHQDRLKHIKNRGDSDDSHRRHIELRDEIELLLLAAERQKINELYRSGRLKDEARRRIERELDVREAHLANQQTGK
jgi:CPA1 family monovalent cation:H+ antiporter